MRLFLAALLILFFPPTKAAADCGVPQGAHSQLVEHLDNIALVVKIDDFNWHFKDATGCRGREKQCAERKCFDTCNPFLRSEKEIHQWNDAFPKKFLPETITDLYVKKIKAIFKCSGSEPIVTDFPPLGEFSPEAGFPNWKFKPQILTVFVTVTLMDSKHPNEETLTPNMAILSQFLYRPISSQGHVWPPLATAFSLNGKEEEVAAAIDGFLNKHAFIHIDPPDEDQ